MPASRQLHAYMVHIRDNGNRSRLSRFFVFKLPRKYSRQITWNRHLSWDYETSYCNNNTILLAGFNYFFLRSLNWWQRLQSGKSRTIIVSSCRLTSASEYGCMYIQLCMERNNIYRYSTFRLVTVKKHQCSLVAQLRYLQSVNWNVFLHKLFISLIISLYQQR